MRATRQAIMGLLAPLGVSITSMPLKRWRGGKPYQIPRSFGRDRMSALQVELIGPGNNLEAITIRGALATDDYGLARRSGETVAEALKLIAPDWPERESWLKAAMLGGLAEPARGEHGPWRFTLAKGADQFLSLTADRRAPE